MPEAALLDVRGLGKDYGPLTALRSVTLRAYGGEIFGLLGANGAGKTTLLRLLSTLLRPSRGGGSVAGHDLLTRARQVRGAVGLVSGGMGLPDRLSGREILQYFGALYGLGPAETQERIHELTRQLGLETVLERRAGGFSTGMRQKLLVARALLHQPPVLLLDEASSGLDVLARRQLLDLTLSLRGPERLIVYSTHVMSEVEELCDRIAVLSGGEVLRVGSVPELLAFTGQASLERAFFALLGEG